MIFCLMIDMNCVHQVKQVVIIETVSSQSCDRLQLIKSDVVIIISIHLSKNSSKPFLGFNVSNRRGNQVNKLFKIDRFVPRFKTLNDSIDECSFSRLTQFFHDLVDLLRINYTRFILIEYIESCPQLFVFLRMKTFFP